ncbi:hypothetical protein SAY86_011961 [Trapa natans]|uniref:BAH domain-containing protein n=1 Tax=Trapa natans TaxID=22666 RepID=A0AAN7R8S9_TRANT|nr:hypothetical protein SAY86_011961 [Trapa natans]
MEDMMQCFTSLEPFVSVLIHVQSIILAADFLIFLVGISLSTSVNTKIQVHSFVFIMAEFDEPEEGHYYLAYSEDMHEDRMGLKKVIVRWFYLTREICHMFPQYNPHPRETFITPQVEVICADCVEEPATVVHLRNSYVLWA